MSAPVSADPLAKQWHQYGTEGDACPGCDKDSLERDAADIGVGVLFGPWYCLECGWREPAQDAGIIIESDEVDL